MNAVRSKVMEDMKPYMDFAKHKDLIAFVIGEEYFSYDIENDVELEQYQKKLQYPINIKKKDLRMAKYLVT